MVAIIKNNFRLNGAKEFIKNFAITVTDKNYYLFVGKPLPWLPPEGQQESLTINSSNADLYPPLPKDTLYEERRIWDEMLGLKKIRPGDVSLVIPRSDWKSRTIYPVFDDSDPKLYQRPTLEDVQAARAKTPLVEQQDPNLGYRKAGNFYVLNSLNELFVCVWNNNGGISTVEPVRSGSPTNLVSDPDDGYVWKYITSVTSGDAAKFLTDAWLPIKTLGINEDNGTGQRQVQDSAKAGEVLCVVVTNSDTNPITFDNTYDGTITIGNSASNNTATLGAGASATLNTYAGYQLHIVHPTTDVRHIFNILSYDEDGVVTIEGNFNSLSSGQQYDCVILPSLTVSSNGTESPVLVPVVDTTTKKLVSVEVLSSGENSTFVSIIVSRPVLSGGTLVLPTVRAILSPLSGLGKNPEKDLGAFFVMISTQIRYDEGENVGSNLSDFPVKNDYRQIGILQNARRNDGTATPDLCTQQTLSATKKIRVQFDSSLTLGIAGDPGFKSDEEIQIKNADGTVSLGKIKAIDFRFFDRDTEFSVYTGEVSLVQTPETGYVTLAVDQKVEGLTSTAKGKIIEVIDEELLKFSGDILYIENRRPILRSVDQIEDIKTIVEF